MAGNEENIPNYNRGQNNRANYYQQLKETRKQKSAVRFNKLGLPSLLYGMIFAIGIYHSVDGFFNLFAAIATVVYISYVAKISEKEFGKFEKFNSACIILLSISNFLTGNGTIIFFNYMAILLLIIVTGIYMFVDVKDVLTSIQISTMVVIPIMAIEKMFNAVGDFFSNITTISLKKNKKLVYVIIGVCITIPFFVIICGLLMSADGVFNSIFESIFDKLHIADVIFDIISIGFLFVLGYMASYGMVANLQERSYEFKKGKIKNGEPIIAIIFTAAISFLYLIFSVIQIYYLFLGNGQLPDDYTYAEYAREGFFQLLFVCLFNMVIVLVCNEFFRKNIVLKILNFVVCGCTFIMIASSTYRMKMYVDEYGLTFIRVLVLWALLVITVLMVGLIKQIMDIKFNLFKYSVVVVSVLYIAFSFSHPDYYIATYDLAMYENLEKSGIDYVDYDYINDLSSDAAPAILKHKDAVFNHLGNYEWKIKNCDWAHIRVEYTDYTKNKIGIRNFNVSHFIAQSNFQKYFNEDSRKIGE